MNVILRILVKNSNTNVILFSAHICKVTKICVSTDQSMRLPQVVYSLCIKDQGKEWEDPLALL